MNHIKPKTTILISHISAAASMDVVSYATLTWLAIPTFQMTPDWKEIIFTARGKRGKSVPLPSPCLDIERVSSLRVLGVIVNDQLTATDHVSNILASCNSLLYALRILRSPASQSLRYMMSFVLPSSRSWPTAHHRGPVRALPPTALTSHSSADARDLNTAAVKCLHLTDEADDILFSRIMANQGHVLQPLLPDRHFIPYSLR